MENSQERLDLAAKLDQELDEFIDSLPQRKQEEEIPFERWEDELVNHPFFLKDTPESGDKVHPLYEGLQKLKYDPEENEPEDLAVSYKEDGNFNFKHKKYRMAVISYTEGIKIKCGNPEIEATLYNNRSAAHYFLKNYRSALLDCEQALKIKPDYTKSKIRAANCYYQVENYEKALEFCDGVLENNSEDKEILELRQKCVSGSKNKERNKRKRELADKKLKLEEQAVISEIIKRGIKISGAENSNLTLTKLEPQFPQLFSSRVSVTESGTLVWPVILFYPEYKILDYIQKFDETSTFLDQFVEVFADFPEWDSDRKYRPEAVSVYFEDQKKKNVKIDVNKSLLEVLKMKGFVVAEGTPRFVVLVAGSTAESRFLSSS